MKIGFALLFFLFAIKGFAQSADNTSSFNTSNIYYRALAEYIDFSKQNSNKVFNKTSDTIYIENKTSITDRILTDYKKTTFSIISGIEIMNLLKREKSFILYSIFPLTFSKGEFSVSFVPFFVKKGKKRKSLSYINTGNYKVVFAFENNTFHFLRVEVWGI